MQRSLLALFFLLLWPGLLAAECLEVADKGFELAQEEFGGATMQWHAEIANQCDASYDAVLTVDFRDLEGEPVHSVKDRVILGVRGRERLQKEVFMSADAAEQASDITISVEERERPF